MFRRSQQQSLRWVHGCDPRSGSRWQRRDRRHAAGSVSRPESLATHQEQRDGNPAIRSAVAPVKENTMRAAAVTDYGATPGVAEIPTPEPARGQVLIKLRAAGMNPMDMQRIIRSYTNSARPRHP